MRMVGVDVGGTFTDAVVYDEESGELRWAKAPSTPADPSGGVLAALARNDADLASAGRFVHATSAIVSREMSASISAESILAIARADAVQVAVAPDRADQSRDPRDR